MKGLPIHSHSKRTIANTFFRFVGIVLVNRPQIPPPAPLVVPDVFFQSLSGTRIRSSRHSGVPDNKVFRTSGTQNGWLERLRAQFLPKRPSQMSWRTSGAAKSSQNDTTDVLPAALLLCCLATILPCRHTAPRCPAAILPCCLAALRSKRDTRDTPSHI